MSLRPLALVSGLTVGDYFLWSWSLNGNHTVLALISGLTLPVLSLALVWLLALSGARLLGGFARRRSAGAPGRRRQGAASAPQPADVAIAAGDESSRKLAA